MSYLPHARSALMLIFAILTAPTSASEQQGLRYAALSQAQPIDGDAELEVVQVFWYGCPSCGSLDDQLNALLEESSHDISFRRMPAIAPRWEPHARAFYAAESLGALDHFHPALTEAMRSDPKRLMSEDDLMRFVAELGLDTDAFRQAYHSAEVEQQVQKAAELTEHYGIAGVPALIINGQYRTDLQLAGDQEAMIEVLQELIEKPTTSPSARGRNRGPG